jgi:hypothetical protein
MAAMASAWDVSSNRLAASISSVVVRPLPHSRATRRKGALVIPAMGASRVVALISTGPIFTALSGQIKMGRVGRLAAPKPSSRVEYTCGPISEPGESGGPSQARADAAGHPADVEIAWVGGRTRE